MRNAIVTGSAGLVGSQAVKFLSEKGFKVIGIDNGMRKYFFGENASTDNTKKYLISNIENYVHHSVDIRDAAEIDKIFETHASECDIIVHTAAQPSHDWAAREPFTDFSVNAIGTLNLLESTRKYCPSATFIFTSTNKVYGDRPNFLPIVEMKTRYECLVDNNPYSIDENFSIDQSKHSLFGASKVAADILCQEYGRYFGLKTGIFRGGCLTGPDHAGAELHGFLSYLVKCVVHDKPYTIFGYKGKQVRDNIHSQDILNMFWEFHLNPKCGEVYNIGGGRDNSCSILEAIDKINIYANKKWNLYSINEQNRIGDHIWYITDLTKFKKHYPNWNINISLDNIIQEMVNKELKVG
jgi:CDP-paratose 2-epimerase